MKNNSMCSRVNEQKGTEKVKWRDLKGPLFLVLEIKKGL